VQLRSVFLFIRRYNAHEQTMFADKTLTSIKRVRNNNWSSVWIEKRKSIVGVLVTTNKHISTNDLSIASSIIVIDIADDTTEFSKIAKKKIDQTLMKNELPVTVMRLEPNTSTTSRTQDGVKFGFLTNTHCTDNAVFLLSAQTGISTASTENKTTAGESLAFAHLFASTSNNSKKKDKSHQRSWDELLAKHFNANTEISTPNGVIQILNFNDLINTDATVKEYFKKCIIFDDRMFNKTFAVCPNELLTFNIQIHLVYMRCVEYLARKTGDITSNIHMCSYANINAGQLINSQSDIISELLIRDEKQMSPEIKTLLLSDNLRTNTMEMSYGMSMSAMRVEEHQLCKLVYLISGAPKIWLFLPHLSAAQFLRTLLRLNLNDTLSITTPNSLNPQWASLQANTLVVTPDFLKLHNIPYEIFIQRVGTCVLVKDGIYHQTINLGTNVSASMIFRSPRSNYMLSYNAQISLRMDAMNATTTRDTNNTLEMENSVLMDDMTTTANYTDAIDSCCILTYRKPQSIYQCAFCQLKFYRAIFLTRHMKTVHEPSTTTCSYCQQTVLTRTLTCHEFHHAKDRGLCIFCGNTFKRLNKHLFDVHRINLSGKIFKSNEWRKKYCSLSTQMSQSSSLLCALRNTKLRTEIGKITKKKNIFLSACQRIYTCCYK